MKTFLMIALLVMASTAQAQNKLWLYEFDVKGGFYNPTNENYITEQMMKFVTDTARIQVKLVKEKCVHIGRPYFKQTDKMKADGIYTLTTTEALTQHQVNALKASICSGGCGDVKVSIHSTEAKDLVFLTGDISDKSKTFKLKDPSEPVPTLSNSCVSGRDFDSAIDAFSYEGARMYLHQQGINVKGAQALKIVDKNGHVFAVGGLNANKNLPETERLPAAVPATKSGRN